jgi:hypothetical protein
MDPDRHECFEPVLHGALENLYRHHPTATVMLTVRPVDDWVASVEHWNHLGDQLKATCQGPGYFTQWRDRNVTNDDLARLYVDHAQMVRSFVQAHSSLTFIEVDLTFNKTGSILEERIGIPQICWGSKNVNMGKLKKTELIS